MASNKRLIAAGALGGAADVIDIDNFDLTSRTTFNPSEVGIYSGGGCAYGNNGNIFYAGSEYAPSGIVYQYNTPSAYTFPTTADTANKDLDGSYMYNFKINDDGSKFFVYEYYTASDKRIQRYDMSSNWNVSTASLVSAQRIDYSYLINLTTGSNLGGAFAFTSDGSSFYVCLNNGSNSVHQLAFHKWDLSTAWDISGVSSTSPTSSSGFITLSGISGSGNYDYCRDMYVNDSETQLIVSVLNNLVVQFDLTTAGDLSTASYTKKRSFNATQAYGPTYYPDAQIAIFFTDGGGTYDQYDYVP